MYIFILVWLLLCYKVMRRDNFLHLIIAILPVFIVIAFRGESVGVDTRGYLGTMEIVKQIDSFSQLFELSGFEKGFLILCYGITKLGLSDQWLLILEAIIFCASVIYFCKYNANDKFFIMLAIVLSLLEFTLSGLRQTIAISISLFAYKYAREQRLIIYCLLSLLAFSFHTSSVLIFPFYWVLNKKLDKKVFIIYSIILICSLLFIEFIFNEVASLLNYDEYVLEGLDGGYVSFMGSLIFCIIVFERYGKEIGNLKFQQASHYTILFMMFSVIRFVNVMMMRVLLYFSVYPYLMIDSLSLNQISKRYKKIAIVYLILYFIYRQNSLENYIFYWE